MAPQYGSNYPLSDTLKLTVGPSRANGNSIDYIDVFSNTNWYFGSATDQRLNTKQRHKLTPNCTEQVSGPRQIRLEKKKNQRISTPNFYWFYHIPPVSEFPTSGGSSTGSSSFRAGGSNFSAALAMPIWKGLFETLRCSQSFSCCWLTRSIARKHCICCGFADSVQNLELFVFFQVRCLFFAL